MQICYTLPFSLFINFVSITIFNYYYYCRITGFVLEAISGYVRTKSYNIKNMEERERDIKTKAEEIVSNSLSLPKRVIFNWLLFHARRAVKHRENMRFARTKIFGIFREIFRSMGHNLVRMRLLDDKQVQHIITLSPNQSVNLSLHVSHSNTVKPVYSGHLGT